MRNIFKAFFFLSSALILLSGTSCYFFFPYQTETFEQTYNALEVKNLSINNVTGNITVLGGAGTEISVKAVKKSWFGSELENVEIMVTEGDDFRIESLYPAMKSTNVSVDYTIIVPYDLSVKVTNVTGSVYVDSIEAMESITTITGDISVLNCERVTKIMTTTGNIDVDVVYLDKDAKISSMTGSIKARIKPGINATLNTSVMTGKCTIEGAVPYGTHSIDISVMTGNITVSSL